LDEAVTNYSNAILSIRYLLREGIIDMNSLNSGYVGPVIVPCNLNLALCYLKLSEGLILKNAQDKRKDQLLEKCVKVCDDVLTLWKM
jgi:hypothetical protein